MNKDTRERGHEGDCQEDKLRAYSATHVMTCDSQEGRYASPIFHLHI